MRGKRAIFAGELFQIQPGQLILRDVSSNFQAGRAWATTPPLPAVKAFEPITT